MVILLSSPEDKASVEFVNSGTTDSFKSLDQNVALVWSFGLSDCVPRATICSKKQQFDLNVGKRHPVRDVTNSALRLYLTGVIILSRDLWHGKPCYYSEGLTFHIYNLFNNTSPIGNLVGNQTMCCRRLKMLPTRKIARISGREWMTCMACPMTFCLQDLLFAIKLFFVDD